MLEYVFLGIIQGITEWLPISSEGVLVLASTRILSLPLSEAIHLALFLHLGTFFAALVYLRKDVLILLKTLLNYKMADEISKHELRVLIIASATTAIVAFPLLALIDEASTALAIGSSALGIVIGVPLLVTGYVSMATESATDGEHHKDIPSHSDALLTGFTQGLAVIPGISRSGITVATLLFRNVNEIQALRYSFLLSLPTVLGGNILINAGKISTIGSAEILALASSFIVGILTIHALLKIARKISWGWFTFSAGALLIFAALL
ncbi:MAG: undecaprenyl-diphosphate phosphatase [bacterium]|nr:undecaprenyl-diphosphate phosphatase [bacterium]